MSETYTYTKASVNLVKLNLEIVAEGFSQVLEKSKNTLAGSDNLLITFVAALTGGEATTLDALVATHDGNPPTTYTPFCYDCGCSHEVQALSAPTVCPICAGTDIQTAYHNDNLDATDDPNADNDVTEGYCEGSKWINVSTEKVFVCTDNTDGSAKWSSISIIRKDIGWASDKDANLEVISGTHRVPILFAGSPISITIKSIRAMVGTAPTDDDIVLDIHKNGTTIFTEQEGRPTIADGEYDSGEVVDIDVTTLAKGDYLTLDIDQIGSTIAGKDLVVTLEIEVVR